jgi:protein-tyrosine phosphatase
VPDPIGTARRILGPAYRWMRRLPERLTHAGRHRRELARLARGPRPRRLLVLCYGNVCRSPYLEVALQAAMPDVVVESAGFVGPDRAAPEFAAEVAMAHGYDLSAHRSKLVTEEMVQRADLVLVMDESQLRDVVADHRASASRVVVVGDLDPLPRSVRTIPDPWNKPRAAFEESYTRLDRCAAAFVAASAR